MTEGTPQKIPVVFYRTPAGAEVVRDWLRGLDEAARNAIGQDLMRAQFRWPIGMPLVRAMDCGNCAANCRATRLRGCFSALRRAI